MGSYIGCIILGIVIGEMVTLTMIALTSKNRIEEERS